VPVESVTPQLAPLASLGCAKFAIPDDRSRRKPIQRAYRHTPLLSRQPSCPRWNSTCPVSEAKHGLPHRFGRAVGLRLETSPGVIVCRQRARAFSVNLFNLGSPLAATPFAREPLAQVRTLRDGSGVRRPRPSPSYVKIQVLSVSPRVSHMVPDDFPGIPADL
jgi:hypothetical protein